MCTCICISICIYIYMYMHTSLGLPLSARASYVVVSNITVYCRTVFRWCYTEYLALYVACVAIWHMLHFRCCSFFRWNGQCVLQCVAVWYSVCELQCVAVCLADVTLSIWPCVRQCVAVCCSVLHCAALCCIVFRWCYVEILAVCSAVCCSVLLRWVLAGACCNVLQCAAVCCSVLQCVAVWCYAEYVVVIAALCCSVLQLQFLHAQLIPHALFLSLSLSIDSFFFFPALYVRNAFRNKNSLSHTLSLFFFELKARKKRAMDRTSEWARERGKRAGDRLGPPPPRMCVWGGRGGGGEGRNRETGIRARLYA